MPVCLTPKLLTTHTFNFLRPNPGKLKMGGGYEPDGEPSVIPNVKGSLQPINTGLSVKIVPQGYDTGSAYFFYTKSKLSGYVEGSSIKADYTVIDDREYEVHRSNKWSGFGLKTDHYKYLLVAKPLG